jgi:hypothetical protein
VPSNEVNADCASVPRNETPDPAERGRAVFACRGLSG